MAGGVKARPAANPKRSAYVDELLALILNSLDDSKATDVAPISLAGKSSIADFMVIASGTSSRQVASIAGNLMERIKAAGFGSCRVEGQQQGDWVVVDAGDVVVHVFRPEVREFYNLEKLWSAVMPADYPADLPSPERSPGSAPAGPLRRAI